MGSQMQSPETEIRKALELVLRFIEPSIPLTELQKQTFEQKFIEALQQKFNLHWQPSSPYQGNAYRSITVFNGMVDPLLIKIGQYAEITEQQLQDALPKELVIWIDPYEVCYRTGETGPIIKYYEDYSRGKLAEILEKRQQSTVKVVMRSPDN